LRDLFAGAKLLYLLSSYRHKKGLSSVLCYYLGLVYYATVTIGRITDFVRPSVCTITGKQKGLA